MLGTDGKISTAPSESTDQPPESGQNTLELLPDATPRSAHSRTSTDAPERWAYGWVDRRLKIMSVLLPVAFILGLELLHYRIEARDQRLDAYWDGYHAVLRCRHRCVDPGLRPGDVPVHRPRAAAGREAEP